MKKTVSEVLDKYRSDTAVHRVLSSYAERTAPPAPAVVLRSQVGISGPDPETRTGWMHVAPLGEWKGHDSGPFEVTPEVIDATIATFNAQKNALSVDYGHASVYAFEAPASGYVQKLERRDDGLWALVEWTKRAATAIREGEYRFCSAVFLWNQKHRQTGEKVLCQLHSIALTNVPFIDGQQPIALSRRAGPAVPVELVTREASATGGAELGELAKKIATAAASGSGSISPADAARMIELLTPIAMGGAEPAPAAMSVRLDACDPRVIALRQRAELKGIPSGPSQDAFVREHLPFMGPRP